MKTNLATRLPIFFLIIALFTQPLSPSIVNAESADAWWDEDWPYRVALSVSNSGAVSVQPDFSALFSELGLPGALLDLASLRIVPYTDGTPGNPVSYEETLSVLIMDGETLTFDSTGSDPFWTPGDQSLIFLDSQRFSEGTSAIRVELARKANLSLEPDFTYSFEGTAIDDWSAYETMVYDVWPEVNETAIDQTTDLFRMDFRGVQFCPLAKVNSPSLVMDQWNRSSISLNPLARCTESDFSEMEGVRFFLSTLQPGGFDVGDELTLWLDNWRLVDQDGEGKIRWVADEQVDRYYLYFDTFNHIGHLEPETTTLGESCELGSVGAPESGGYFSLVSGVSTSNLTIWSAPNVEKIFKTQAVPVMDSPLIIHAARQEFEAFQLVLHSTTDQTVPITTGDLVGPKAVIPAGHIRVFRVDTVPLSQLSDFYGRLVDWPDPLYPLSQGASIQLSAGENQPLWVRVEVPGNTPAGEYAGHVTVGTTQIPYILEVHDVTLPESAFLEFSAGFDWETVFSAYGASDPQVPPTCLTQLESAVLDTLAEYHLTPNPNLDEVLTPTLTEYEVRESQTYQTQTGLPVWWAFTGWDDPPFANPAVIDRPGMDAHMLPTLAWLDRVDGLYTTQVVDWDSSPWTVPFSNDLSNGDGFLFYPPNDASLGYDPCEEDSNRLIPSIRIELLREGLEYYAYLYLLNDGKPEIGAENPSDLQAQTVAFSRTAFTRIPTEISDLREALLDSLEGTLNHTYFPVVTQ